jgi:hypothetical protein
VSLASLLCRGQTGLDSYPVTVEVHLSGGLPSFAITGLAAAAVRESRDRVRAALQTSGFEFPVSRITAHLGPADVPKQGGRFDLAIALGVLRAHAKRESWATCGPSRARCRRGSRRAATAAPSCCRPATPTRPRSRPRRRSTSRGT